MSQTSIENNRIGISRGQLIPKLAPHSTRAGIVAAGKTVAPGIPVIVVGEGPRAELIVRPIEDGDVITHANFGGFVQGDELRTNEAGEGYGEGMSVAIVESGVIASAPISGVATFRGPVYVGNATAQLGEISGSPGSGLVQLPGARFYSGAGIGDFAKIQLQSITAPSVGAVVPTAAADGSVLVADGGEWTQLAPGSSGQVLTIGSNGPEWATP